jgi:hypothetical protein
MNCRKQFEQDLKAEQYLKRVKRIHYLARWQSFGYFPKYTRSERHSRLMLSRLKAQFSDDMRTAIPLRVEIINTNANQLHLNLK